MHNVFLNETELARLEEEALAKRDMHLKAAEEAEIDAKAYARLREIRNRDMANTFIAELTSATPTPAKLNIGNSNSFTEIVKMAAFCFQEEFTIPAILERLKEGGIPLPENNPNQRVWMILNQMCKDQHIKVTHKGRGVDPNRYRVVPSESP